MNTTIHLKPIQRAEEDYEAIEKRLKRFFKDHLYYPLLKELGLAQTTLKNDTPHPNPLMDALYIGRVTYNQGVFSGKFNAAISKELRRIGARFDRKNATYKLALSSLPFNERIELQNVISAGEDKFQKKVSKINKRLADLSPSELAKEFKCQDLFDRTLWKANRRFRQNIKNITVAPQLNESQRKQIAKEWQNNMEYWIQGWTEEKIIKLRKEIQESVLKGNRWGSLIDTIETSYKESAEHAKFLARQETHLLLAKFNKAQYLDAGVPHYKWKCVHRPKDSSPNQHTPGNVRYYHGILDGSNQRWDQPPKTDGKGNRNNPGEDYNCIPEDELVSLHAPTIKAFRRRYTGELTCLTTQTGETLRVTRNHPVLTLRGWIPAHLIELSDYLIQAPTQNSNIFIDDPQSWNSKAGELFSSFLQKGLSHRISGRTTWFHGDSTGEDINIVSLNRKLFDNKITIFNQEISNNILTGTDSSGSRQGFFSSGFICRDHTSNSVMSRFSEFQFFGTRSLRHSQIHRFGSSADINVMSQENSTNGTPTNFQFFSDRLLARSILVHPNNFIFRKIKSIIRYSWTGFVHNFETITGWYSSNNLIVHNCRCYGIPIVIFKKEK
jgi:hypothetical protein